MLIYTIFERPSDYPDHYVVREFHVTKEGSRPGFARIAETLEEARWLIPLDLELISRASDDDPCIVESWM